MSRCACPRHGRTLCAACAALLRRAEGMPSMTEAQLQAQVLLIAKRLGWELRYHTYSSKRSAPGFPDLVLCRPGRLLFAELKRDGDTPTLPQQQWLAGLRASVPGVEVYTWSPASLETIVTVLRR